MLLLILASICLRLPPLCVGNVATLPARNRRARIRSAATYGNVRVSSGPQRARFQDRVLSPFVTSLARAMLRLNAKQNLESLSQLLMSAGMRNTSRADVPGGEGHLAPAEGFCSASSSARSRRSTAVFVFAQHAGRGRLHRAGDRRLAAREATAGAIVAAASRCARSACSERRGRPRLRRSSREADAVHGGPALRGVRAGARRDADRREPPGRAEEAGAARRHARSRLRSSGRSCRRISSARPSDASCACRRPTRVSSGRPPPKSAP